MVSKELLFFFSALGAFADAEYLTFEGDYESEELGVSYKVKRRGNTLVTYIGDREIATFRPIYQYYFTSEHDGFLNFDDNGFNMNDYSLGTIRFTKKKDDSK